MYYNNINGPTSAVIAAGGKGARMGAGLNKQYIEILGRPVLARTIQAFEECGRIDEIIVVVSENEIDYCKENIIVKNAFKKVRAVVAGGESRQRSVLNGLRNVSPECGIVLIHDGARPFVDKADICSCIDAAVEFGSACAAVPVKDTVKCSDGSGFVAETLDRSNLWSIQTPQAFQYGLIMEAHEKAAEEGFEATDDASLAERLGYKVRLVMSGYYNIKITTREDMAFAEAIARTAG